MIDGKKTLPDGWVKDATANHVPKAQAEKGDAYGYFWWPMEDGYRAVGIFCQGIFVYPEENSSSPSIQPCPRNLTGLRARRRKPCSAIRSAANGE